MRSLARPRRRRDATFDTPIAPTITIAIFKMSKRQRLDGHANAASSVVLRTYAVVRGVASFLSVAEACNARAVTGEWMVSACSASLGRR